MTFFEYLEVNKRTKGKSYEMILNCLTSRAGYIDIANNYSTEWLLVTLQQFLSLRGFQEKMYLDCGLVAAGKEFRDAVKGFDQNHLLQYGVDKGIRFII